jgi:hypothetical protein
MADPKFPLAGGCQCGAVRYRLRAAPLPAIICHCTECQKQTASAFGMTLPVLRRDLELLSGDLKEWRRPTDSGREQACFFCPACGTRLYHSSSLGADYWHLKPGTLDDTSWLAPAAQVWTRSAQPWLRLAGGLPSTPAQPEDLRALLRL